MFDLSDRGPESVQAIVAILVTLLLLCGIVYLFLAWFGASSAVAAPTRAEVQILDYDGTYLYFGGLTVRQRLASHALQDMLKATGHSPLEKAHLHPYLNVVRHLDEQSLKEIIEGKLSLDEVLKLA